MNIITFSYGVQGPKKSKYLQCCPTFCPRARIRPPEGFNPARCPRELPQQLTYSFHTLHMNWKITFHAHHLDINMAVTKLIASAEPSKALGLMICSLLSIILLYYANTQTNLRLTKARQ